LGQIKKFVDPLASTLIEKTFEQQSVILQVFNAGGWIAAVVPEII
jgi:hypothetical protein